MEKGTCAYYDAIVTSKCKLTATFLLLFYFSTLTNIFVQALLYFVAGDEFQRIGGGRA